MKNSLEKKLGSCHYCQGLIVAQRSTAKFCSNICRSFYSMSKKSSCPPVFDEKILIKWSDMMYSKKAKAVYKNIGLTAEYLERLQEDAQEAYQAYENLKIKIEQIKDYLDKVQRKKSEIVAQIRNIDYLKATKSVQKKYTSESPQKIGVPQIIEIIGAVSHDIYSLENVEAQKQKLIKDNESLKIELDKWRKKMYFYEEQFREAQINKIHYRDMIADWTEKMQVFLSKKDKKTSLKEKSN